jgi:hypothetical protein
MKEIISGNFIPIQVVPACRYSKERSVKLGNIPRFYKNRFNTYTLKSFINLEAKSGNSNNYTTYLQEEDNVFVHVNGKSHTSEPAALNITVTPVLLFYVKKYEN